MPTAARLVRLGVEDEVDRATEGRREGFSCIVSLNSSSLTNSLVGADLTGAYLGPPLA